MAISLQSLQKHTAKPPRIIVYGDAGLGKTTFAVSAPKPVVIQTEDGLGTLDATAFPLATSFDDVMDALTALYTEDHDYQTLVLDSLDWLEPLIWQRVCLDNKLETIEKLPYGRGYVESVYHWRAFFDGITALRDSKNMAVIMTAHNEIRRVEDPTLPAYDRHDLKLHKRAAAVAEEFADIILFAAMQTNLVSEDAGFNQKRIRTTTTGQRVMHTTGQPAFLAKTRFPLPPVLPLAWGALSEAMTAAIPQPTTTTKGK